MPADGTSCRDRNKNSVIDLGEGGAAGVENTAAMITGGEIKHRPAANGNGSPYASLTFKVSDGKDSSAAATMKAAQESCQWGR